jgi:hypothetical protein
MTMQNVEGTGEARDALSALAYNTLTRAQTLGEELQQLAREAGNINIGARAALRAVDDDVEWRTEEGNQLRHVLGATPSEPAATVVDSPAVLPAPTGPAVNLPPPAGQPTAQLPAAQRPDRATRVIRVRDWTALQWVLACIGAIGGLIVGASTFRPVLHLAGAYHKAGSHPLVAHWAPAIAIPWVILCVLVLFFAGAFIGALIEEGRDRRNDPVVEEVPVAAA